ncbi:hypothetical protein SCHIN_v1c06920 [Spiroplasma chinense]|uniref:DUF4238 domain-containing protein n=1 Tax=Spiroplasma chinense TaxID=216932 RepID=A0A5B9Y5C1_9MOLU|nr:hypothetical protein [Spiroplasma chinense]QEH61889.1 hypothetical protein SCHIN_v1c06920 [Spiroplasma chinense]
MFDKAGLNKKKKLKRNLLLPTSFLNKWISVNDEGEECFKYVDFVSDEIVEVKVENDPFLSVLFATDESFDMQRILKQYDQIAKIARAIVDRRVDKEGERTVKMTGKEVLFVKYFYFLVSLLNGDYKYLFDSYGESYRIFDVLNADAPKDVRKGILSIISYTLFEMFDYIFSPRVFESLYEYVENSDVNFNHQEYKRRIIVPAKALDEQNYKFMDVFFHNVVNNTFLKVFTVSPLDREKFLLTNKTIANFIDEKTKINVLSVFVVDPSCAIGLVNLGPGRGEYRPLFKFLSNNRINVSVIPSCLRPEHELEEDGIYLSDEQRFYFKPFELTDNQVKLINDCLTYRDLKTDLDLFTKY